MARKRGLRPEEQELWNMVARTARPMHSATHNLPEPARLEEPAALAPPKPKPPVFPEGLRPFKLGARAKAPTPPNDLAPTPGQLMSGGPIKMDAGKHRAMTRGKLAPEAKLDLHGLTLAEAHPELIRFLMNAQSDGLRLVLVITGKGKDRDFGGPIPSRIGALRHQLPHWLNLPPLRQLVLQTSEAHLKHGGGGAFYIYLRRTR